MTTWAEKYATAGPEGTPSYETIGRPKGLLRTGARAGQGAWPSLHPGPRMRFFVNGAEREVVILGHESLLTTLRERLFLTGAKLGCDRGECGACTVLLDGDAVYACLTLTAACAGRQVRTIEGLEGREGTLHPVQQAFIECDAVQCGYCTPGQVLSAVALLARDPAPCADAVASGMSGNLCRCGTYPKIRQAIALAASRIAAAETGA